MIPVYPQNSDVTVSVDVPEVDGSAVVPTSLTYTVLDERGEVISGPTAAVIADGKVSATIPAADNVLTAGVVRSLRAVSFAFVAPNGGFLVDARYVIEAHSKLILMQNSFQTFEEAILTRMDLPALDGWDVASETDQIAALVVAHDRMCRVTYRYRLGMNAVEYDASDPYWYITDMHLRSVADFNGFPDLLKTALRRAQVYEADNVLNGDPVGDKRLSGVISESVGESKMFFSNTPPVRTPLCRQALAVLGPHLYRSNRIGRA